MNEKGGDEASKTKKMREIFFTDSLPIELSQIGIRSKLQASVELVNANKISGGTPMRILYEMEVG